MGQFIAFIPMIFRWFGAFRGLMGFIVPAWPYIRKMIRRPAVGVA